MKDITKQVRKRRSDIALLKMERMLTQSTTNLHFKVLERYLYLYKNTFSDMLKEESVKGVIEKVEEKLLKVNDEQDPISSM